MITLAFLRYADLAVTIAVNSAVLCFSFTAYRRTGMRAFAFWIVAGTMSIILSVGLHTYGYSRTVSAEDYRSFMQFYRIAYIIEAVLSGAGCIMLIRHLLAKLDAGAAPNQSAPPNGGPAMQSGNSGVAEGPPSVS